MQDAIVDRGFILGNSLALLLIKRRAQRLFTAERLSIFGFQIGQESARVAGARLVQMLLQFGNLLIDLLDFGCFLGRVNQQLRPLLFQISQLLLRVIHVLIACFRERAGGARGLRGVVLGLGHLAIVFGFE